MEMLLGAVVGVVLFLGGFYVGHKTATPPKVYAPNDDLTVEPSDSRKDKAAKMEQQFKNLMSYTGRTQYDED